MLVHASYLLHLRPEADTGLLPFSDEALHHSDKDLHVFLLFLYSGPESLVVCRHFIEFCLWTAGKPDFVYIGHSLWILTVYQVQQRATFAFIANACAR